jgi:hypothetical protein
MPENDQRWRKYEATAQKLLNQYAEHFGLGAVEGKQVLPGKISGTDWEIDAKGICLNGKDFIIVECRNYASSKLSQEHLAAIAFRVTDTGAGGAITVTPNGLQLGAQLIAAIANIKDVRLRSDSTTDEYLITSNRFIAMGLKDTVRLHVSDELRMFSIDENGVRHPVVMPPPLPEDKTGQ